MCSTYVCNLHIYIFNAYLKYMLDTAKRQSVQADWRANTATRSSLRDAVYSRIWKLSGLQPGLSFTLRRRVVCRTRGWIIQENSVLSALLQIENNRFLHVCQYPLSVSHCPQSTIIYKPISTIANPIQDLNTKDLFSQSELSITAPSWFTQQLSVLWNG